MASERIILIRGDRSKWFEQAIFIVKKNIPQSSVPVDFVAEAERIINGYLLSGASGQTGPASKDSAAPGRARSRARAKTLFAVILAGALILAGLAWYALRG